MESFHLTIVLTGRNDNYGGDFNVRLFRALRFNHERLHEQGIPHDVVFVEWNPVPGERYLSELLQDEFGGPAGCPVTCYVADARYQRAYTQNPRLAYLEFIAKNAGIRRAAGSFVLSTNTDVFLGRRVVETLASRALRDDTLYRAVRIDVKLGADQSALDWESLEDVRNHVRTPQLAPPLYSGGTGDFLLASSALWARLRGFNEVYRAARVGVDYNLLVKAHGAGVPIVDIGGPVFHINHVGSFRIFKRLYGDSPAETAWGNRRWHSRHVVYENRDDWGLAAAPERPLRAGITELAFASACVPPLLELRRVVLPMARSDAPFDERFASNDRGETNDGLVGPAEDTGGNSPAAT